MNLSTYYSRIVLASASPRRRELMKMLEYEFSVESTDCDESFPSHLKEGAIAEYLARKKSMACRISENELWITADTIVWCEGMLLGKPQSEAEAFRMLKILSGKKHSVFTGVTLRTLQRLHSFVEKTEVSFRLLPDDLIEYYIKKYRPLDKAGSYGVQEFIGAVGIEKIEGCFYNVMGLPTSRLYEELKKFLPQ